MIEKTAGRPGGRTVCFLLEELGRVFMSAIERRDLTERQVRHIMSIMNKFTVKEGIDFDAGIYLRSPGAICPSG